MHLSYDQSLHQDAANEVQDPAVTLVIITQMSRLGCATANGTHCDVYPVGQAGMQQPGLPSESCTYILITPLAL